MTQEYKNYKKGPLQLHLSRWSSNRQYLTATVSFLTKKMTVSITLSTAPSGIFFNGSLSGKTITDYLNNYGKKKASIGNGGGPEKVIPTIKKGTSVLEAVKKIRVATDDLNLNELSKTAARPSTYHAGTYMQNAWPEDYPPHSPSEMGK